MRWKAAAAIESKRSLGGTRLGSAQGRGAPVVHVETGNADRGTWHFQLQPGGLVQHVPFRAVPARVLVHLSAALRLGPTTLFGSVENLFGERHAGNVVANEGFGRFYEPGFPARLSLGLGLAPRAGGT